MTQMPNPNQQFQQQTPVRPDPPPEEPGWHFRWWILCVLAAIALVAFVVNNIEPSISWLQAMDAIHVPFRSRERYSQTVVLGLVVVGALLVIKVLWSEEEK